MKTIPTLLIAATLLTAAPLFAQDTSRAPAAKTPATAGTGKLIPVGEKDAAWAAKARETYPLQVCVTSDEKLGGMGDSAQYIYRVEGKPDRLVVFCCEGCEEDFMKEPAKYVAKLDAAAKARSGTGKSGAAKQKQNKEPRE